MKYIAYYRVSTQKQGRSGLGLEAQREAVSRFLKPGDEILEHFTEVETGKRDDRPQLQMAIAQVRHCGASLLIAKIDRLSRNAGFIFKLRDSRIPFVAADIPDANHLTIGFMAVIADHERQMISERTRDSLAALKARGVKLGTPANLTDEARRAGRCAMQKKALEDPRNRQAAAFILSLYKHGDSYSSICRQLNEHGFKTRRNCSFSPATVKRLIDRYL